MTTLNEIEQLAHAHAEARSELQDTLNTLQAEMDAIKESYMKTLRDKAATCAITGGELKTAIEQGKALFDKPRTRIFHGIKVGYQKGKGKLVWLDEGKVLERIKAAYRDDVGVLIETTERINRKALQSLSVKDLKAIGVTVEGTEDQIVIKATEGDIDKMIDALLTEQEAA